MVPSIQTGLDEGRKTLVRIQEDGEENPGDALQTEEAQANDTQEKTGAGKMDKKKKMQLIAAQREHELASRNANYILQYLVRRTHFDADQVKALMAIYKKFKGSYNMDRLRLREMVASVFGITDSIMLDRIFQAFDGDNEGHVSETEWIIGLSILLKGTLDEHIAYTYDVYDINGDRSLGRDEIQSCLRGSLHPIPGVMDPEDLDEAMNDIVEIAMKKFDLNRDGNIRFYEYRHAVRQDPLLLEAFGECLPNEKAAVPFVSLIDMNARNYNIFLSRPGDPAWTKERERYRKLPRRTLFQRSFPTIIEEDTKWSTPSGASGTDSPVLWSMSAIDVAKEDLGQKAGVAAIRSKDKAIPRPDKKKVKPTKPTRRK